MSKQRLLAAAWAAFLALPAAAGATEAAEDEARDEAIFGESTGSTEDASRDEEIFGESTGSTDDASRDEDIFGESEGSTVVPASTRSEGSGGDGLLSSSQIDQRLDLAGDKLAIGGLLYLRAQYSGAEGTLVERDPIASPNLLDVYFDARPNDNLRAFARGRLTHTFAEGQATGVDTGFGGEASGADLDQLWINFNLEHRLFVTAGRQPIRWGASRFWNPTDFVNDRVRDPLAIFDERLGVSLVKVHLPIESSGWNLYAIADLEEASTVEQMGGAFRVEKLIGSTEVTLSTALRKDRPWRVGADLSFPLWEFDVRAEVAMLYGDEQRYWRGDFDLSSLENGEATLQERVAGVKLPEAWDRSDEWIPQAVLGADLAIKYSDEDNVVLGAEYFYNGAGTDDPALYPWLLSNGFSPLYLGQHYGAVYANATAPGSWNDTSFTASVLGNLTDRSFVGRFDYRVRLLTYLDFNAFVASHFGEAGEFRLAMQVPRVAELEGASEEQLAQLGLGPAMGAMLASGVDQPAPLLELGAGLQLRF
ncbi:hypothetical protein [Vulgatibacter sp.]|uniref:hypothetical protein n=1 Tax=Vulgatibacter sp. TaxID=1971226 RepID=UPI00356814E8